MGERRRGSNRVTEEEYKDLESKALHAVFKDRDYIKRLGNLRHDYKSDKVGDDQIGDRLVQIFKKLEKAQSAQR